MAEPLKATFFAFRKREQNGVLLKTSIAFVVILIALYAVFAGIVWAIFGSSGDLAGLLQDDPEAIAAIMSPGNIAWSMLGYLILLFSLFILLAAFEAGCLRWMVRGETKGLFGLALDDDTWRVYGIYWVWFLAFFLGFIAISVFAGLFRAMVGDSPLIIAVPILAVLTPIVLGVRLAPAAATAIAERRFAFFDAWKVSHDRFWALFGSFLLLWLIYLLLACAISGGWMYWALGPHLADIMAARDDPMAMSMAVNEAIEAALSAPGALAVYIGIQLVSLLIAMVFYVTLFGVNARAAVAALEEGKIEPESAG